MAGIVNPTINRESDHSQKLGEIAVSKPPAISIPRQRKKEVFLPTLFKYNEIVLDRLIVFN